MAKDRHWTGREENIEIAVVVVITPCARALLDIRKTRARVRERAVAIVVVKDARSLIRRTRCRRARQQEIEVSVVVVVPPGQRCLAQVAQSGSDVGKRSVVVVVENP